MHLMPIDDTTAAALFLDYEGQWCARYLDAASGTVGGFNFPASAQIVAATVNPVSGSIWALIDGGDLLAFSREDQTVAQVPPPPRPFPPLTVKFLDGRFYLAGLNGHIWYFDIAKMDWVSVNEPPERPDIDPRPDSVPVPDHTRSVMSEQFAYVRENPAIFDVFAVGSDHYFVGSGGHVMRLRAGRLDDLWLDSGYRLAQGRAEGGRAVISACDLRSEIYAGTFEDGFERIFEDDVAALHMTALHGGTRYIGAAYDEDYKGPTLFTLTDGELIPVQTAPPDSIEIPEEPGILTSLSSTGGALWVSDIEGAYHLSGGQWRHFLLDPAPD